MLELKVPKKLADPKLKRSSDELMKSIERNYGWLAIEYVQWVINNKDEVIEVTIGNTEQARSTRRVGIGKQVPGQQGVPRR